MHLAAGRRILLDDGVVRLGRVVGPGGDGDVEAVPLGVDLSLGVGLADQIGRIHRRRPALAGQQDDDQSDDCDDQDSEHPGDPGPRAGASRFGLGLDRLGAANRPAQSLGLGGVAPCCIEIGVGFVHHAGRRGIGIRRVGHPPGSAGCRDAGSRKAGDRGSGDHAGRGSGLDRGTSVEERLERDGHCGRRCVALVGRGGKGPQCDLVQGGGHGRVEGRRPRRRADPSGSADRLHGVPFPRRATGEHFVEQEAQGLHIGSLGRRGAEPGARRGGGARGNRIADVVLYVRGRGIGHGSGGARYAEVRDLDVTVSSDHDIARPKIAMRKSASVSGLQRPRDLGCGAGSSPRRNRPVARQERGQIGPVDILGDQVRAHVVRAEVIDGSDVLVVEAGRDPGLPPEVRHEVGVAGVFGPQQLQSDLSVQLDVVGTVDRGEAALAEQFHEPIAAPDYLSDLGHERSSLGWRRNAA